MTLFQEIDLTTYTGGQITGIEPDSVAAAAGLQAGDELLAVNGEPVVDIIDVQYYAAEEELALTFRRGGEIQTIFAARQYEQTLGLLFAHPTFDTDIRRCNNLCEFCFVLQMAPKFRRTLYIKDDDYRYSFLFGHYVTLTNLSDHDWWRIEHMGLSPLYVSVHDTDLERRRAYLRNANAPDILEQLAWLAERGVEVHTQIVVSPGVNDGRWLKQSLRDLESFWPTVQSISVVPVGLTQQHKYGMRPHTPAEAAATLAVVEALQPGYRRRFGVNFVYPTDEWYLVSDRSVPEQAAYDDVALHENGLGMVRHFLDEWESVKKEIAAHPDSFDFQRLTLVTGTLFGPTLARSAQEFSRLTGVDLEVQSVPNDRFGETITVAGLLMGGDVQNYLTDHPPGDIVLLPRVMFDHPDSIALDDVSPQQMADHLQKPVALADTMGDVWDTLVGQSQVLFQPSHNT